MVCAVRLSAAVAMMLLALEDERWVLSSVFVVSGVVTVSCSMLLFGVILIVQRKILTVGGGCCSVALVRSILSCVSVSGARSFALEKL